MISRSTTSHKSSVKRVDGRVSSLTPRILLSLTRTRSICCNLGMALVRSGSLPLQLRKPDDVTTYTGRRELVARRSLKVWPGTQRGDIHTLLGVRLLPTSAELALLFSSET